MSLLAQVQAADTTSTVAPLRVIASSDCGKYVIGTRSTLGRASLFSRTEKDGEVKHRPAHALTHIASAMSATWADDKGKPVNVF